MGSSTWDSGKTTNMEWIDESVAKLPPCRCIAFENIPSHLQLTYIE